MPRGRQTRLSTLELFLLALIADGVSSMYDLQERAGLSIGGTQPALARLMKQDLVRRTKDSGGRKQDYALTSSGHKKLEESWPGLLQVGLGGGSTDTGSILRLVALALRFGKHKEAITLLDRTHDHRQASLIKTRAAAERLGNDAAANYLAMSKIMAAARIESEATAFNQLRKVIAKR